jgi:stearoyl-CoA desaturase (delta-9 desaturase)
MKNFISEWKPAIFNSTIYLLFVISLFFVNFYQILFLVFLGMLSSILGNAILLHRFYTHKQFNLSRPVEYILLPFSILIGIGSPIMYATIHRQHHRVCDQQGDPHSPSRLGQWKVLSGLWEFFPVSYFKNLNAPVARDLLVDPLQRLIHVYYYRIWFFAFLITATFSWQWAIAIFGWIPVYQKVIENLVVNGICHPGPGIVDWPQFGIFTGGESMQKLHHETPQQIKYSNNWLVDPAWPIIRMIQK